MATLRSPNELVEAGIEIMLDGKAPANRDEQVMLMNFMAANIAHGVEPAACRLMKTLYGDHFGLLTDDDVERIALYQQGLK